MYNNTTIQWTAQADADRANNVSPLQTENGLVATAWCVTKGGEEVPAVLFPDAMGVLTPPPTAFPCTNEPAPSLPSDNSYDVVEGNRQPESTELGIVGTGEAIRNLRADYNVGRFNPPPHYASRRISPINFANFNLTGLDEGSSGVSSAGLEKLMSGTKSFNKRGFIIQDPDSSVYQTGSKSGTTKAVQDLWGFQFMYNPTTISHSNQSTVAYDLNNFDDVANLMVGTQTLTLSLLINRVVDVSALGSSSVNGRTPTTFPGAAVGYPRALSTAEQHGILKRGTEFDLEFLYRAANGDPEENSPTTNGSVYLPTSDFGYLYGSLLWLVLHEHLRYKVYITGINVTHVMFTESMVPILSNVELSLMRVPAPTFGSGTNWFDERRNNSNPALSKQQNEPAETTSTEGAP